MSADDNREESKHAHSEHDDHRQWDYDYDWLRQQEREAEQARRQQQAHDERRQDTGRKATAPAASTRHPHETEDQSSDNADNYYDAEDMAFGSSEPTRKPRGSARRSPRPEHRSTSPIISSSRSRRRRNEEGSRSRSPPRKSNWDEWARKSGVWTTAPRDMPMNCHSVRKDWGAGIPG